MNGRQSLNLKQKEIVIMFRKKMKLIFFTGID